MDTDQSPIVTHFTSSAERYLRAFPDRSHFIMEIFEKFKEDDIKVFDLGCGTGSILEGLSVYFPKFNLYGMDITPEMIKLAVKHRPKSIQWLLGNCLHTPIVSETYDAVILRDVLHHLVTRRRDESNRLREAGLKELIRLTKPGGFIVLKEVCVNAKWRAEGLFHLSNLFSKFNLSIPKLNLHPYIIVNFYTIDELEYTFQKLGLVTVKKECIPTRFQQFPGAWITTLCSAQLHVTYVLNRAS
jgi:ubiquinone/menaquinone biosynthesis C-methylase UbiE